MWMETKAPRTVTASMGCAGGGGPVAIAHHFIAMNNVVHDLGGAGLSSCSAEYITWRNNEVYGTSGHQPLSGIGHQRLETPGHSTGIVPGHRGG